MKRPVSPVRHAAECEIYSHAQRDEIERDFINWRSQAIAGQTADFRYCKKDPQTARLSA